MSTSNRRVVVTGVNGISPLGNDWPSIRAGARRRIIGMIAGCSTL